MNEKGKPIQLTPSLLKRTRDWRTLRTSQQTETACIQNVSM